MKTQLNAAIKATGVTVDEVTLFREMAKVFNTRVSSATYVEEVHNHKVEFWSRFGRNVEVELGDLLLLTYDKATAELRICVLQAKYKKGRYYQFLNFKADIVQWELLKEKPIIFNKSRKFEFPSNILNFRDDYESITAYGIFFEDNISKELDFLYTLPKYIWPHSMPARMVKNGRAFHFRCPKKLGSPKRMCRAGITAKETVSTCSIDVFEEQVLRCKVGAPINDKEVKKWVGQLLAGCKSRATVPDVIDEVLSYLDVETNIAEDKYELEEAPAVMVVVTDSEKVEHRLPDCF